MACATHHNRSAPPFHTFSHIEIVFVDVIEASDSCCSCTSSSSSSCRCCCCCCCWRCCCWRDVGIAAADTGDIRRRVAVQLAIISGGKLYIWVFQWLQLQKKQLLMSTYICRVLSSSNCCCVSLSRVPISLDTSSADIFLHSRRNSSTRISILSSLLLLDENKDSNSISIERTCFSSWYSESFRNKLYQSPDFH